MRTTLLRDSQERNLKSREVRAWRACERIRSIESTRSLLREERSSDDSARYREISRDIASAAAFAYRRRRIDEKKLGSLAS